MADRGEPDVEAVAEQLAAVNIQDEPVGELGWDELRDQIITINEVEYRRIRLRLVPPPQPSTCYVFLGDGEGNFTFSSAFAALRGSPSGIFSTDITVQEDQEIRDVWPRRLRLEIIRRLPDGPPTFEALGPPIWKTEKRS
ncbi:hypothetical protein BOX15_Mlig032777g1 [Macrostomum lignano]|uniref:Uncharacterized protein n=1 Tax=Macrostomum lignano TaxID=282301 RepID=A0A267GLG0_9PLAT|nr:hypothetical protein BOX15_Mlig032777g1 [Macrostomum lignano]